MPTLTGVTDLDRASHKRSDTDWIARQRETADARYMLLVELSPCIVSNEDRTQTAIRWFSRSDIETFDLARENPIFLGLDAGQNPYFALNLNAHRARVIDGGPDILKPWVDLRTLAVEGVVPMHELSLIGQAKSLAAWQLTARCCGHCGGTTTIKDGGWRRKCWSCGQQHFPRMDPAVIMLISDGARCILAHETHFPDAMYSTLAGFVEPGEDIEHAVRREVKEEVDIDVGEVTYLSSQPWPFPHSLMIGCIGRALSTTITLDPSEIEDARWFTRDEMRRMLDGTHPEGIAPPTKFSIANKLVRHFVENG